MSLLQCRFPPPLNKQEMKLFKMFLWFWSKLIDGVLLSWVRRRAFFSSRQHVLVLVLNRIADTRLPEVISLSSVLLTVALANLSRYYVAWGDLNKLLFSPSICASCLFVTDKPTVSVKFIEINSDKAYTSIWSDSDFSQLTMLENEKKSE